MENECQHIISGELLYFDAFANTSNVAISNPLFNIKLYMCPPKTLKKTKKNCTWLNSLFISMDFRTTSCQLYQSMLGSTKPLFPNFLNFCQTSQYNIIST